jgi:hypothetical protein
LRVCKLVYCLRNEARGRSVTCAVYGQVVAVITSSHGENIDSDWWMGSHTWYTPRDRQSQVCLLFFPWRCGDAACQHHAPGINSYIDKMQLAFFCNPECPCTPLVPDYFVCGCGWYFFPSCQRLFAVCITLRVPRLGALLMPLSEYLL